MKVTIDGSGNITAEGDLLSGSGVIEFPTNKSALPDFPTGYKVTGSSPNRALRSPLGEVIVVEEGSEQTVLESFPTGPAVVVASSVAPISAKRAAAYVCVGDGTDHLAINQAMLDASVSGEQFGKVELSGGPFICSDQIQYLTGVWLDGKGDLTEIRALGMGAGKAQMVLASVNVHAARISNLVLNGNSSAGGSCAGIDFDNTGGVFTDDTDTSPDVVFQLLGLRFKFHGSAATPRYGLRLLGTRGASFIERIRMKQSRLGAFIDTPDNYINLFDVSSSDQDGLTVDGGNNTVNNVKAWFNHRDGIILSGARCRSSNLQTQDNYRWGAQVSAADVAIAGYTGDSNGGEDNTGGGLNVTSDVAVVGNINIFDRNAGHTYRQLRGIGLSGARKNVVLGPGIIDVPSGNLHIDGVTSGAGVRLSSLVAMTNGVFQATLTTDIAGQSNKVAAALYQNFDRTQASNTAGIALVNRQMRLIHITLPIGTKVTSFTLTAGGTGYTAGSGATNKYLWGALYSYDGTTFTLLSQSANDSAPVWAANTTKTFTLGTPQTVAYQGDYYLAVMIGDDGTTPTVPTLLGQTTSSVNSGRTPPLCGNSDASLSATAPATTTTISATGGTPLAEVA